MTGDTTMSDTPTGLAGHEPSLHTVEMVCDRLAELGVARAGWVPGPGWWS